MASDTMPVSGITSPKHVNAAAMISFAWDKQAFTASNAMKATGLTRTTVIAQCDELVDRGWFVELDDARAAGEYTKGRPARRYELNARAGYVVGVDASAYAVTASVTDLRGTEISRRWRALSPGEERVHVADAVITDAMHSAHVHHDEVMCVAVGVPSPVNERGESPSPHGYWHAMNPGFSTYLGERFAHVIVENDATLGAVAEGQCGAGVGASSYVTFLLRHGIGTGVVIDGHPIRGVQGAAGELWMLGHIRGIGAGGIDDVMRDFATDLPMPESSALRGLRAITIEEVTAATLNGDSYAAQILQVTAEHLASICVAVGGILDVERIIFSGTNRPIAELVRQTSHAVENRWHPDFRAPSVVVSHLGDAGVTRGAVIHALAWIKNSFPRHIGTNAPGVHTRPKE